MIGVFGGDESGMAQRAHALGAAVAHCGHVLLTGGLPRANSPRTTESAQVGAMTAGKAAGAAARAIAVTPLGNPALEVKDFGSLRVLHVSTGLTSEDRDLTNAATADIAIALEGGTGTLLEIAFARAFGKPIYFPGSQSQLREKHRELTRDGTLREFMKSALANYPSVNGRAVTVSEVDLALREAIEFGVPLDPNDADRSMVDVLARTPTARNALPEFPGIPPDHAETTRSFFELWSTLLHP